MDGIVLVIVADFGYSQNVIPSVYTQANSVFGDWSFGTTLTLLHHSATAGTD